MSFVGLAECRMLILMVLASWVRSVLALAFSVRRGHWVAFPSPAQAQNEHEVQNPGQLQMLVWWGQFVVSELVEIPGTVNLDQDCYFALQMFSLVPEHLALRG
jgi:hypothetical protein